MTTLFQWFKNYQISLMLITLLITLESFYSYYLSLNIVYVLTLVVLILQALSKIDKIKKKDFRLPNNFLIFFLIIFLLSIISHTYYKPNIEYKFFFKTLYALIFIYCLAISIKYENLRNILSIILLIHSGLLIIQFITFYCFFVQIDFFNLLWGLEQKGAHLPYRFDRSVSSNFLDLKRFSGLFNEPGTYCNVIGILSCLLSNIKDLNKFHKIILCISSLSLLLTFSVYGYLFFIIIFISYTYNYYPKFNFKNLKKDRLNNFIILLIIFFILYLLLNYAFPYFRSRFFDYSYQSGLYLRFFGAIEYFNFLSKDWFLLVFGKGMINETYAFYETTITYDASLFLYLLSRSGVFIFFICFIFSLYLFKFNKSKLCTFLLIMLSKLSLFSPIVLFGLYMIIQNFNDKK